MCRVGVGVIVLEWMCRIALADRDAISGFAAVQQQSPWLTSQTGCVRLLVGSLVLWLEVNWALTRERTIRGREAVIQQTPGPLETQQRIV
jgi:hypothetical protein